MALSLSLSAPEQDAGYALRSIRRDLGFFAVAMVIIGLGIGASTAVFSVMRPLMFKPLPFDHPGRLVWVANGRTGGMSMVTSRTSNLRDFRALSDSFEGLTGYFAFFEAASYNLVGEGQPERLIGVDVARDFLDVLGVEPHPGRNFVDEEGLWGGPPAVILSRAFWQRRFGGDPGVVGTSITLNNRATEVVGVLPATFDFASLFAPHTRVDFLRPFPISDETDRWGNTLSMIGRLKPGATVASAQAELDAIIRGLKEADPERWGLGAVVTELQRQIASPFRSGLLLLAAAAAAVMLIVCVNLSNLLLARWPRRSQEMAVRSAFGAPRSRLMRQLLFESLLLALGGAVSGAGVATLATRWVASSTGINIPLLRTVAVDGTALWFAFLAAVVAGLLVGIVPALRVSVGEATTLRSAPRGSSANRRNTRLLECLVIAEVALACMLLVFGGLLLKSFFRVLEVELGFQPAGVVGWRVNTARSFETREAENAFYDQLVAGVESVPGVETVGLTDAGPLGRNRTWTLGAPGIEYDDGATWLGAFPHIVDRRYLETMGIPLVAGRHFAASDTPESDRVVILNQSAADAVYRGDDVLGRTVISGDTEYRVVGIAADVRHVSLEQDSGLEMYLPMTQNGDFNTLDLMVRSDLPEASLVSGVTAALQAIDPAMPATDYQSLDAIIDRTVSPRRFTLSILGAFAGTALVLAALGIYGVLSYSVSERVPEIGIRMALGESQSRVLGRVVGKTMWLAGLGVGAGVAGSFGISRILESLLYGVQPTDPPTLLSMVLILLSVSALAGLVPGLRASRTDPSQALRSS